MDHLNIKSGKLEIIRKYGNIIRFIYSRGYKKEWMRHLIRMDKNRMLKKNQKEKEK